MSIKTAICYGGPWHGSKISTLKKYTEWKTPSGARYRLWRFAIDETRVVTAWISEDEDPESEDVLGFVKSKNT